MNVMKIIRLRWGNALLSSSSNGIESAAAKDTTPRIPAQPRMNGDFHQGLGSAKVIKRLINLVNTEAPNLHSSGSLYRSSIPIVSIRCNTRRWI